MIRSDDISSVLDDLAAEVISGLPSLSEDEKMTWSQQIDASGITHMMVIHIYAKKNIWYVINGIMRRYVSQIMAPQCSRVMVIAEDDSVSVRERYKVSVIHIEDSDNYYLLVPMRYSGTPYDFFIALQKIMKILKSIKFDYDFEMFRRNIGEKFEDLTKYIIDYVRRTRDNDAIERMPAYVITGLSGLEDDGKHVVTSATDAKNNMLFKTLKVWGIFRDDITESKIETDYMRVLIRE